MINRKLQQSYWQTGVLRRWLEKMKDRKSNKKAKLGHRSVTNSRLNLKNDDAIEGILKIFFVAVEKPFSSCKSSKLHFVERYAKTPHIFFPRIQGISIV